MPGGAYFFTINLSERRTELLTQEIDALLEVARRTRAEPLFDIDAGVVLRDPMHGIITLPIGNEHHRTASGRKKTAL